MKRSLQEVVELVVFGLVALLVGTAVVWVLGWVLALGGALFKALAGLLWLLLRFIVPIAIVAGLIYFLVKALQGREGGAALAGAGGPDTSDLAQSASREAVQNVQKVVDEMDIDVGSAGSQATAGGQRGPMPASGAGADEPGGMAAATGDEDEPLDDSRAGTDDESRSGDPDENA